MSSPLCTVHYSETREIVLYSLVEKNALVKTYVTEVHEVYRLYSYTTHRFGKYLDDNLLPRQEEVLKSFPLREISLEELEQLRNQKIPGFVLKEYDKYYFAHIPENEKILCIQNFCSHQCANCNRMSAESDECGGCQKVRTGARYIENFEWIDIGYETFNTRLNVFFVSQCSHHCNIPKRKFVSKRQRQKILQDFEELALEVLYPKPAPTCKRDPNA